LTPVEIAVLVASCAVVLLVIFTIPILIDLRRMVRDLKKLSELAEIGMMPVTWAISFLSNVFQKLVEKGEEAGAKTDGGDKK